MKVEPKTITVTSASGIYARAVNISAGPGNASSRRMKWPPGRLVGNWASRPVAIAQTRNAATMNQPRTAST